jgi:hypothetical protein
MYTLKIKWTRHDFENNGEIVDETTLFIPADEIWAHAEVNSLDEMKAWKEGDFQDYSVVDFEGKFSARIIKVEKNNKSTWYLASHAWLLGPDGKTIECLHKGQV